MMRATSVQITSDADILAFIFQLDRTQWICLRSVSAGPNRGWLECWSSKEGLSPDIALALEAVSSIVRDHLKFGPLGAYIEGAHFFPGWHTWGGSVPAPIAQYRAPDIVANAEGPLSLETYLAQSGSVSGD